jgi:hypothetical protein
LATVKEALSAAPGLVEVRFVLFDHESHAAYSAALDSIGR